MTTRRCPLTRRTLLAGAAIGVVATVAPTAPALAAKRKATRSAAPAKDEPAFTGTALPIPRLVDLVGGATFELVAEATRHAFVEGKPVDALGYGGTYMGPVLRLKRGTRPKIRLVNRLARPTNVHWHGLLGPANRDAATHPGLMIGESLETELVVDQPAATLWYHAHVHGRTARDVHDGLAGLMIVEDEASAALGLPSTWGVDDLPLILQDRDLDPTGRPDYEATVAVMEHGFRGRDMLVNGVTAAVARVPHRLVRLRLLNAANARTFRLAFEDQRSFRLIATDSGFLSEPAELSTLVLAPGERAEILVDFAEGTGVLLTGPDEHDHRMGSVTAVVPDVIDRPTRLVAFDVVRDDRPGAALPARLGEPAAPAGPTGGLRRRRIELRTRANPAFAAAGGRDQRVPRGAMANALETIEQPVLLTVNGRSYAADRIDETIALGATEIWEIVSPDMAHPFHLHGARFRVLTEDGDKPKTWNRGAKDTVLVENSVELLVTFSHPADAKAPFLYQSHLLEHADGGMMGTFTVG